MSKDNLENWLTDLESGIVPESEDVADAVDTVDADPLPTGSFEDDEAEAPGLNRAPAMQTVSTGGLSELW